MSILFNCHYYFLSGGRPWTINAWAEQRHRDTMEDAFNVEQIQLNGREALILAVFDGHGGNHAADYCKEHLISNICKKIQSWDEKTVFEALKEAFSDTNLAMKNTKCK